VLEPVSGSLSFPSAIILKEGAMSRLSFALLVSGALMVAPGLQAAPPTSKNFVTHLAGYNEVPARATNATGQAIFHVAKDGQSLTYKLIASNIDNVVASHIHVGGSGVNGPVVAFLYGPAPPAGGRQNGVLATGTITAFDLVGPLAGQPLSALLAAMLNGDTYVNVHTNNGVAPANEGPGDFPGGEIRGQIREAGPSK